MAKELKRRGFRFVGPTTCYALMQAAGLVDDHVADLLAGRVTLTADGDTTAPVDRSDYRPVRSMRKDGRQGVLPRAPQRACHGWYR